MSIYDACVRTVGLRDLALGLTVRRRPPLLNTVRVNAIYFRFFVVRPRKGVSHQVSLTLDITYVRCVFGNTAELVLLPNRLRVGLLVH